MISILKLYYICVKVLCFQVILRVGPVRTHTALVLAMIFASLSFAFRFLYDDLVSGWAYVSVCAAFHSTDLYELLRMALTWNVVRYFSCVLHRGHFSSFHSHRCLDRFFSFFFFLSGCFCRVARRRKLRFDWAKQVRLCCHLSKALYMNLFNQP